MRPAELGALGFWVPQLKVPWVPLHSMSLLLCQAGEGTVSPASPDLRMVVVWCLQRAGRMATVRILLPPRRVTLLFLPRHLILST